MLQNDDRYNLFVNEFSSVLKELVKNKEFSNLVFLCVGTDRVTGDSFGPLVGYKLKSLFKDTKKVKVFGSLETIVSASNVARVVKEIEEDSFIIAIDSAISNTKKVGSIVVRDSSIILGKGLGKQILKIGDMSIKGVVGKI
jgi:putative sporulation protein YyaC